jgi:DNA polymerase (family 10)
VRKKFLHAITHAQEHLKDIVVHAGMTVDVREDGSLDAAPGALDEMAIVRAELSNAHGLEEKVRTTRLIAAINSGKVQVVARPTAVFQKEKLAQIDAEAIAKAAKKRGVLLELDGRPERLASADGYARVARDVGAKLFVASHATKPDELGWVRYGIDQARRGWCAANDVANTEKSPKFVEA